jgi:ribosomal protein S18 acetylase RimI-like enzyme
MSDYTFEIRPITENDLEDVLEVYKQCEDFLALGPEPRASMAMVIKDTETSRSERSLFCGVFASDGKMIGIVEYVPGDFNGETHLAFIALLMIVAPSRNQGIGTRVLEFIEGKIRATGRVSEIRTAVQVNNPAALRFWQRNHYRVFGDPERRPDQTVVSHLRKVLLNSDRA